MSRTLGKMVPTAVVLMLVGWCGWPYLERPRPSTALHQGGDLPRIAGSLLSAAIEPASDRDPFQPPAARAPDPLPSRRPTAPPPHPEGPRPKAPVEDTSANILAGLALGAIYIQGDRRVALINDRVYAQGERLAISASAAEPCIVSQISADRVLLLYRGQTVELEYAGQAVKAAAAKAVEQRRETHRKLP